LGGKHYSRANCAQKNSVKMRIRYLFSHLNKLDKVIGRPLLIFLDYDGTLSPIVKRPEAARLSRQKKETLRKLSKNKNCRVAVISGRSLTDVKGKVGLGDIIYSGNHGLEISGPGIKFRAAVPKKYKLILNAIKTRLKKELSSVKGVIFEDKGFCFALHYRMAPKEKIPLVKSVFKAVTSPYVIERKIRIKSGKKVFDIAPALKWNKGSAVTLLMRRQKLIPGKKAIFPIYAGDDLTDEDAFKALMGKGLTVFIGKPKKTFAEYYLKNTTELFRFLKALTVCRNV